MPDERTHALSKLAEELVGDLRGVEYAEPRRQVKRATQPLAAVVEQLLIQHQIGHDSPEQKIRDHWAELVGSANAAYSHPVRIERNNLIVLAGHAVVRNELFHHRVEIARKIRALPGCEKVKGLTLRAG